MATVPEEDNPNDESFADAFPDYVRTVVTGKPTGTLSINLLFIVIAICFVFAPTPAAAVGIIATMLLVYRWKWDKS